LYDFNNEVVKYPAIYLIYIEGLERGGGGSDWVYDRLWCRQLSGSGFIPYVVVRTVRAFSKMSCMAPAYTKSITSASSAGVSIIVMEIAKTSRSPIGKLMTTSLLSLSCDSHKLRTARHGFHRVISRRQIIGDPAKGFSHHGRLAIVFGDIVCPLGSTAVSAFVILFYASFKRASTRLIPGRLQTSAKI
jgi:hypothetical protein